MYRSTYQIVERKVWVHDCELIYNLDVGGRDIHIDKLILVIMSQQVGNQSCFVETRRTRRISDPVVLVQIQDLVYCYLSL